MRFEPNTCPVCKKPAYGVQEDVPGLALLTESDENGEFEYTNETKMSWDGQTPVTDDEGRVTVQCRDGHAWQAIQDPEEDDIAGVYEVLLNNKFCETERGNIWLMYEATSCDWHNAYISLGDDLYLEIAIRPENYPGFTCQITRVSETDLWLHLINEFGTDWIVRKFNLADRKEEELRKAWNVKEQKENQQAVAGD